MSDINTDFENDDKAYLRIVGERVRLQRIRHAISRRQLAQKSGVSERYLAELERGTGNASLLIMRKIARALDLTVSDFIIEKAEGSIDVVLTRMQLEQLTPDEIRQARSILAQHFGPQKIGSPNRIALIGLAESEKSQIGQHAAKLLGIPFVDIDEEIEKSCGMELSELFSSHSEEAYRQLEFEFLTRMIAKFDRAIISTGSGIISSEKSFSSLLKNFFTVWLRTDSSEQIERAHITIPIRSTRPLSKQARAELNLILENRLPLYARADAGLDISGRSVDQVARELADLIKSNDRREQVATLHAAAVNS